MLILRKLVSELTFGMKLVLMSATMQGPKFVQYFQAAFEADQVAPPVFVGIRRFPVNEYFIDEVGKLAARKVECWNEPQQLALRSLQLLATSHVIRDVPIGDWENRTCLTIDCAREVCTEVILSQARLGESIVVFFSGIGEILEYYDILQTQLHARQLEHHFRVFVLHSQIPLEEQQNTLQNAPSGIVHVILSTNVIESAVTIPQLKMVLNFGTRRAPEYNRNYKIVYLKKKWCSRASCMQRAGRVGRLCEGTVLHLFPRQIYDEVLSDYDTPEICVSSLAKLLLHARKIGSEIGIPRLSQFLNLAIEPPSLAQLDAAVQELAFIGAIVCPVGGKADELADITLIGHMSLQLPLELEFSRLVLYSLCFGCPVEGVVMAASMSLPRDVFSLPSRCLIQNQGSFLSSLRRNLKSRYDFDGGSYSDPIMMCCLFKTWCEFLLESKKCNTNKRTAAICFCKMHSLSPERLLLLENLVVNIATHLLKLMSRQTLFLYQQISILACMGQRRQHFESTSSAERRNLYTLSELIFTSDTDLVRALIVASFSHNLLVGVRRTLSQHDRERKAAIIAQNAIKDLQFNMASTIVLHPLQCPSKAALEQLAKTVLPQSKCRSEVVGNMGFVET